jgi:hypothetical protein
LKAQKTGATQSGIAVWNRQIKDERVGVGKSDTPSQQTGFNAAVKAQQSGATQAGMAVWNRQITDDRVEVSKNNTPSQQTGFDSAVKAQQSGATASGVIYGKKREIGGKDINK